MQQRAFILEAHHITHIEGTHLNLDQSEKLLAGKKVPGVDSDDVKELFNYKKAFDFVAEYLFSTGPITEGLIREIHKKLVDGVRGDSALPGKYQTIQNYVANSNTKEVIYTPPPAYEVPIMMSEFVDWLQNEIAIPSVLVAGIAQFQLVHIHPFLDGNGRTARLLSTLCLYRSGYDFKKLFTISEYYDRNRQDYYHAIQSIRSNGLDLTTWLEYFTKALSAQMHEIRLKGTHAIELDGLALKYSLSGRQKLALEFLLETKKNLTIQEYESLCPSIHRRTLQQDLSHLVELGLISQEGIKKATRYKLMT
jgi:Fic family protein